MGCSARAVLSVKIPEGLQLPAKRNQSEDSQKTENTPPTGNEQNLSPYDGS